MKAKILGLLAAGLMVGPMAASADVVVTISGQGDADGTWNITTVTGTFADLAGQLDDQPWWLNRDAASAFALAVGSGLGFPNDLFVVSGGAFGGPFFAYETYDVFASNDFFRGRWYRSDAATAIVPVSTVSGRITGMWTFALASRVPTSVPELIENLLDAVTGEGPGGSLADKIAIVQAYVEAGDSQSACEMLKSFKNQVSAQSGKKLSEDEATQILSDAGEIRDRLGCGE